MVYILKASDVMAGVFGLQEENVLTDIELETMDKKTFRAHKVVLAGVSPFFRGMFTQEFAENKKNKCELKEVTSSTLAVILKAIYTSALDIDNDNIFEVFAAVHIFQMTKLIDACTEFMFENVNSDNCLLVIKIAEKYGLDAVLKVGEEWLLDHVPDLYLNSEFTQLSKESVCHYLRWARRDSNRLTEDESEEVHFLRAAKRWIEAENDRICFAAELFKEVNFRLIPSSLLAHEVKDLDYMLEKACRPLILDAFEYNSKENEYRKPLLENTLKNPIEKQLFLFLSPITSIIQVATDGKRQSSDLSILTLFYYGVDMRICYVMTCHSYIFVLAISDDYSTLKCGRYEVDTGEWTELAECEEGNAVGASSCLVQDKIILAGGVVCSEDGAEIEHRTVVTFFKPRSDVYSYSIGTNMWKRREDLPSEVCDAAMTILNGTVYVAGGNYSKLLPEAITGNEMYANNMDNDVWVEKKSMHENRCNFSLQPIGNKLYAVGGSKIQLPRGQRKLVSLVEIYDPILDQWTTLDKSKVAIGVEYPASFVTGDRLYILGGRRNGCSSVMNCINCTTLEITDSLVMLPEVCERIQCAYVDANMQRR